ncbi:MAG: iron complex outermembrane receptor protein, partial [Saprospiraceae bacterium]
NNSWKNTTTLAYTKNRKGYAALRNGLQYNRDKHELSISFNGTIGKSWNTEFGGTYFPTADQKWNSIYISTEDQIGGRLAYDYNLTDQNQIGVQYQGSKINPNVNGKTITNLNLINENASVSFMNSGIDDRERNAHLENVHMISNLDTTGKQLSFDADYFIYQQKGNSIFDIEAFEEGNQSLGLSRSRTVISSQKIQNYSIKADMQHPTKNINWNYGLKYSRNNSDNDIFNYDRITGESILDPNLTNTFAYQEDISAAYISGAKQVSDRCNVKLGMRLESTSSVGYSALLDQENRNGFSRLFPTAYFSYNQSKDHQYNLSIGGRVNRASFRDLNPFRIYLTNTAYFEGNPFIQPSYTYTFNFNYVYKGKYTTTAYFNRQQNGFGTLFVPYPEDRVLATLRDNFYNANYFGIGEIFSLDISNRWSIQNQVYLMYNHTSTYNNYDALAQNGFQYYLSNNHNITMGKGWNTQLNTWYNSSAKSNIFKVDSTWNVSIGIKNKLLNDKLQISLNVNDIFNQSGLDRLSSEINGVLNSYGQNYSSRSIRLTVSYNFGNEKIDVRSREFGNEETQRRS